MILRTTDLGHLRWHLLLLLASSCIGAAAIVASNRLLAHAQDGQRAALSRLDAARTRFTSAEEDRSNMAAYTQEYGALYKRGIIGDEHRLDWMEEMERIRKKHHVPKLDYAISPQRSLPPAAEAEQAEARMSGMSLRFELLHEEQLLEFLGELRASPHGMFILDSCDMERATNEAFPLRAACAGQWLTLSGKGSA